MDLTTIGIAIGCIFFIIVIGCQLFQKQINKNEELLTENRNLKSNLNLEVTRNRNSILIIEERLDTIEHRQNQADEWFGSVIRHSRSQFSKESVEEFLKEHGMPEEEL